MPDQQPEQQNKKKRYCKIPMDIILDEKYSCLSDTAKLLYFAMLDRSHLSAANCMPYIFFTIPNVMKIMHCQREKAIKLIDELTCIGLISKSGEKGKPTKFLVEDLLSDPDTTSSKIELHQFENRTTPVRKSNPNNNILNNNLLSNNNPITPLSDLFDKFWTAYPRKAARTAAEKAFKKIKPDQELFDKMLQAIENQIKYNPDWAKNNGKYIPYPATWLNDKRWEDEIQQPEPEKPSLKGMSNGSYDLNTLESLINNF